MAKLGGSPNTAPTVNVATPALNCGGHKAYGSCLGGAGMDGKCREQGAGSVGAQERGSEMGGGQLWRECDAHIEAQRHGLPNGEHRLRWGRAHKVCPKGVPSRSHASGILDFTWRDEATAATQPPDARHKLLWGVWPWRRYG